MAVVARWDFTKQVGRTDEERKRELIGNFADSQAKNSAALDNVGLNLGKNQGQLIYSGYRGPIIKEKTLISFFYLNDICPGQFGDNHAAGAALSLESGNEFDALVYAERHERQWSAGSDNWSRTEVPDPYPAELKNLEQIGVPMMVAATYRAVSPGSDEARIALYRNCVKICEYNKGTLQSFGGNEINAIFGPRYIRIGWNDSYGKLNATILAAEIHDTVLDFGAS